MKRLLLVEGVDDLHAVRHLVYQDGAGFSVYYADDKDTPPVERSDFAIQEVGGGDNLGTAISRQLQLGSDIEALGVVTDADDDCGAAWESMLNPMFAYDEDRAFTQISDFDVQNGWVDEVTNAAGDPVRGGVWVMPDNISTGALEDFAAELVPDGDVLWPYAGEVIEELPQRRFKPAHEGKARMHTYLAWQDPPREPIGRSIRYGPLSATSPLAERFMSWVQRLFEL